MWRAPRRQRRRFGETGHGPTCQREFTGGIDIARIKLNGATQLGNRLVPMRKAPLDQGNRSDDVNVVRKTLLGLLKFRQRPGEIVLPVIAVITERKVSLRQVRIERQSTIGGILSCRQPRRAWIVS